MKPDVLNLQIASVVQTALQQGKHLGIQTPQLGLLSYLV